MRWRQALCIVMLAGACAEAEPSWGSASTDGVSVGVEVVQQHFRVSFRNQGLKPVAFVIGGASGAGAMYNFEITAANKRGRSCQLADTTVGSVGGYVAPVVIRIQPGSSSWVAIATKNLRCLQRAGGTPLPDLIATGHSIQLLFKATTDANAWGKLSDSWTGVVRSGEIP